MRRLLDRQIRQGLRCRARRSFHIWTYLTNPVRSRRRGGSQIHAFARSRVTQVSLAVARGGGANWSTVVSAERAAEEEFDLVAIGARELELVSALERQEVFAVHVRAPTSNQAQV